MLSSVPAGVCRGLDETCIPHPEMRHLAMVRVLHPRYELLRGEKIEMHVGMCPNAIRKRSPTVAGRRRAENSDATFPKIGEGNRRHAILGSLGGQSGFVFKIK